MKQEQVENKGVLNNNTGDEGPVTNDYKTVTKQLSLSSLSNHAHLYGDNYPAVCAVPGLSQIDTVTSGATAITVGSPTKGSFVSGSGAAIDGSRSVIALSFTVIYVLYNCFPDVSRLNFVFVLLMFSLTAQCL